jgi:hypothetical protein
MFADSNEDVVMALDASGIKVTNRGEWIRHKWKVRRGYLKIHITVDVKRKKILALKVTDEKVGDGRMLQPLVKDTAKKANITKTIGDGAYDTKSNFRYWLRAELSQSSRCGRTHPAGLVDAYLGSL